MRRLLVVLACALPACLDDGTDTGGGCPEPEPIAYFQSGDYASEAGSPTDSTCESGCSVVFTPHEGVEDFAMSLDLEAETATITFLRDGVAVVERWRISSRESR